MSHEVIERLIDHWRKNFFTEPIVILSFIFCFVVALLYHFKKRERLFFLFYFFIGIMLFVLLTTIIIFKILTGKKYVIFLEVANTIFELAEFIAFYSFFKECLQNKNFGKILKIFLIFLSITIAAFFIRLTYPNYSTDNISKHSLIINVIEFLFLSVMCLAYFYEIFMNISKTNLLQRPSFFIVTSTFFYSVLVIPFFIIAHVIFQTEKTFFSVLFAYHNLLLIIMLLSISKAFLCKIPITT